jgi:hypothetical protein
LSCKRLDKLYLFEDQSIRLPQDTIEICDKFAADLDNSYYIKNRKASQSKVKSQIRYSKIVEFAIAEFLNNEFGKTTQPDVQIYGSKDKSWDSDLQLEFGGETYKIHCKSCSTETSKKFGTSFIFNTGNTKGKFGKDKLFDSSDPLDYVCFAEFNEGDCSVKILALVQWNFIVENSYLSEMGVHQLRHIKKAVYLADLQNPDREIPDPYCPF